MNGINTINLQDLAKHFDTHNKKQTLKSYDYNLLYLSTIWNIPSSHYSIHDERPIHNEGHQAPEKIKKIQFYF